MIEKYVFFDDDRARLAAEFYRGKVYLHLVLKQWGMQILRDVDAAWPQIKRALRSIGYGRITAYNRVDAGDKWLRFMKRFGFREVGRNKEWIFVEVESA